MYLDMWDFPNTYTMGKNFTERLVADYHRTKLGGSVAIVRPTLVCGLAGAPYPGYCGNLAGKARLCRQPAAASCFPSPDQWYDVGMCR